METQSGKRTSSQQQKRARVHLFKDSYTANWPYTVPSECDDYAFCKVCDDSFSIAHGSENYVKTNSSVRQFCVAPSKIADLNRCERHSCRGTIAL